MNSSKHSQNEEESAVMTNIGKCHTITKMFKNAPLPKPKRVIGDIPADDQAIIKKQDPASKRRKIEEP